MIKHYARIYSTNFFMSDITDIEIPNRDYTEIKKPNLGYAFYIYDVKEITDDDGNILRSEPMKFSPTYYWGGKLLNKVNGKHKITVTCLENMKQHNKKQVILTEYGQTFYPEKNFKILTEKNGKWF